MRKYIGVDYHRRYSYMAVMDRKGRVLYERAVENSKEAVAEFLNEAKCDGDSAAVLEATRNWTLMYDWLEELVDEVHLAHPMKVKAIAEAKIKADKIDAKVLAHLLRTDLLPQAYVASQGARQIRSILRQRMFFVRVRTMVKNRVFGLLDRYPKFSEDRPTKDVFSKEGISWLRSLKVKETDRKILDEDLALLEELDRHIERTEDLVESLSNTDEGVKLLRTVPGIGKFFSVLIAYEIDDIGRFANEKKFYSYIGIIPVTRSSGGRTFHGPLTKQGNKYLRWALIEAVWPAIRADGYLRQYYERIRIKKGANPAKVATARKLAGIIYKVLSERRAYRVMGLRLS